MDNMDGTTADWAYQNAQESLEETRAIWETVNKLKRRIETLEADIKQLKEKGITQKDWDNMHKNPYDLRMVIEEQ